MKKLFDLIDSSIDAVLVTSDINRRYFTGFKSSAGVVLMTREKSFLLIDFRYIESAKANVDNFDVILLKNLKEQLSEIFREEKIKRIAVEGEALTVSELEKYKQMFDKVDFETSSLSSAINKLRAVKSDKEIENVIKAQRIAEKAFYELLNFIKPGKTEREIALQLDYLMQSYGSEGVSFETIVISGAKTSMPHGVPSDKAIKNGELLLFDFGAVYNGYHSDMTRTIAIGEPTYEMLCIYDIVLKAQEKAIQGAKAGITAYDYDKIARDYISNQGFGDAFGHSLGHGVGLEIHENPFCSSKNKTKLTPNMIITVEPGIYLPKKFGIRIEDMLIIGEKNADNITKTAKNLIKI